jgi:putative flippase GtrA
MFSTLAYVALYALLRGLTPGPVANALALVVTAVGNTAANRRLTFQVRGPEGLGRDHATGLLALGVALAITSASLALLDALAPRAMPSSSRLERTPR